jgi:hypothetical protein
MAISEAMFAKYLRDFLFKNIESFKAGLEDTYRLDDIFIAVPEGTPAVRLTELAQGGEVRSEVEYNIKITRQG